MNIIDFLPTDYGERRGRRQANLVCLVLCAAAAVVLGGVAGITLLRKAHVYKKRQAVEGEYREASRKIDQLKELEQRKEGLLRKVELSTDLLERVPRSHLVARVTNAMPEHMTLQVLTMTTEEIDVPVKAVPASHDSKQDTNKKSRKKEAIPTVRVPLVQFEIDGLAETDVQVAEYIKTLTADPFFEEVNLKFSEEFPFEEGVQLRRFEIVFRLVRGAERLLQEGPMALQTAAETGEPSPFGLNPRAAAADQGGGDL